jgi:hypothetical protein
MPKPVSKTNIRFFCATQSCSSHSAVASRGRNRALKEHSQSSILSSPKRGRCAGDGEIRRDEMAFHLRSLRGARSVNKIANALREHDFKYRLLGVSTVLLALGRFDRPVRWRDDGPLNIVRTDETEGHRRGRSAGEFADEMNPDISERI